MLQLVIDLLGQMLEVAEKAAAASGRSRRSVGQAGGRGGLRLPGLAGEDDDDDEDNGKQELAALMQKLKVGALLGAGKCRVKQLLLYEECAVG